MHSTYAVTVATPGHDLAVRPVNITESAATCSRDLARQARNIVQHYVLAPFKLQPGHLPPDCPFHPKRDMFHDHEKQKGFKNKVHVQCKYCKKVFKNEEYLDQHLQRKHTDRIPQGATSCLSDMCGMLHCDWFAATLYRGARSKKAKKTLSPPSLRDVHCMPHEMATVRARCLDLAHKCFPIAEHGAGGAKHHHALRDPAHTKWEPVHEFWAQYFCSAASCVAGQRDTLLNAVLDKAGHPHHTVLAILLGVLVVMAVVVVVVWGLVDTKAKLAKRKNDPSGKAGRKPQRPGAGVFNPQPGPYVARRPGAAGGPGTGGAQPGGSAGALLAAGQQMLAGAASAVLPAGTALPWPSQPAPGLQPALSSAPSYRPPPVMPPSPSAPPPPASPQVVHGGIAGGPRQLHQRGGGPGAGPPPALPHGTAFGAGPPPYSPSRPPPGQLPPPPSPPPPAPGGSAGVARGLAFPQTSVSGLLGRPLGGPPARPPAKAD